MAETPAGGSLRLAGGVTSPGPGTVVKYGPYVFYCNLDYENYLNHGHELYLTDNGVVLAYKEYCAHVFDISLQAATREGSRRSPP